MLEEASAKSLLDILLPRILPKDVTFRCLPHEGKQDLEKSIPIKLKNWNIPNTWFVILRDKDQGDSVLIARKLQKLCSASHRSDSLVKIAIHELESWFLGDLAAVGVVFSLPRLAEKQRNAKFRNPDLLANAQEELKKLVTGYQKMSGARNIGLHLNINNNSSPSFNEFISGIASFIAEIRTKLQD